MRERTWAEITSPWHDQTGTWQEASDPEREHPATAEATDEQEDPRVHD